ncbi:CsgG/HfaB family protein [Alloacidobacterium sp.]|uniref:CsgG/HfaB family protein n=1 Tax=Alloacidobacterium sp. TaxID=2951999 RepID=UPI002D5AFA73|nr:CsgG/HfaB family protein [Alloacidobacterium sp.]HYK35703.1 CsgG/HfaB family protein [Alloacidobacterium sp.]
MRFRSTLIFIISAALVAAAFAEDTPAKKRVAVLDFDNAAVSTTSIGVVGTNITYGTNLGKTAADLLVNRLVQDGGCSVIERTALDKLLSEQDFSNSNRADPVTAAKLGRILGVDAIILGSITRYDYNDKMRGRHAYPVVGVTAPKYDVSASVQISARIVSSETAEVLAVAQAAGDSAHKGVKGSNTEYMATMMGGSQGGALGETAHEALDKAVANLAAQVEQNLAKVPARQNSVDGVVAGIEASGNLVLNVGVQRGLKVGDHLQVWRIGKVISDPDTGKVLVHDDTLIGEAILTSVNDISSIATYTGSQPVKEGDHVRSAQHASSTAN